MSALVRLLYPAPAPTRSPLAVIRWWESRRLTFNIVIAGTGAFTLAVVNVLQILPPASFRFGVPLLGVIAYGVLANLFYSAGWAAELLFNAWWKDDPPRVGPILFRQGLIFSVGLTLLPIGMAVIGWVVRILKALV